MQLPGKIPIEDRFFFGIAKKMGRMGVGGGPSAKQRHGGCCVAPGKTAGTGSPAPLVPVSCRYLLVNHCSFFFPSQKQTYQVSRIMRESHAFASSLTLSRMGSTSLTHSNLPSKLTLKAYLRSAQTPSFVLRVLGPIA